MVFSVANITGDAMLSTLHLWFLHICLCSLEESREPLTWPNLQKMCNILYHYMINLVMLMMVLSLPF